MQSFIKWVYGLALSLGGPGLFVVAFLDSSFISLPQINDLLVVLMVVRNKALMPYYAAMATAGSVAGCYVLYLIAERGGEAFLAKRPEGRAHGTRAGALSPPRGAGADGPRDSAAAGTVQAVRADGRRRRGPSAAVRSVDRGRARAPLPRAWGARGRVRRCGARADANPRPRCGDLGRGDHRRRCVRLVVASGD